MRVLKQFLLLVLLGLAVTGSLDAQNARRVTGVVKDATGDPLPGVQVIPVGATASGTVTDFDGNYSVTVPNGINKLSFTFIGMAEQVIDINGRAKIDVTLRESEEVLETVVVTALGIQRKSKTLTYATQSVDSKELTRIKEPNFVNALRGKSAGLQITPNNTGAGGGSTKITLRGQTSILGSNQPLIVLDGVPMSNGMSSQSSDLLMGNSRDGGDILSTINPDDIASLTVLKGPNAAALYGSSANNGVIIITTKSGREGNVRVDVSSATSIDMINLYPELQKTYGISGQGYDAWGKRVADMTADDLAAAPYLTMTPRNTVKDFFNIGFSQNTSVTLSGGTAKAQSYFSYANTYQTGIMPTNKFSRHNVMFKQNYNLFERVNLDMSLNYIHQETNNRPVIGKSLGPLAALYRTPANVDLRYFKHNYAHPGTNADLVVYNPGGMANSSLAGHPIQTWYWYDTDFNNPYWLLNQTSDSNTQDRILGNISIKVKLLEDLNFQTRANVDYVFSRYRDTRFASTQYAVQATGGRLGVGRSHSFDFFQDALLSYNKELSEKLSLQATAGGSYKRVRNRRLTIINQEDTAVYFPNTFLPQNSLSINSDNKRGNSTSTSESWGNNWESALFATATLGWDDKVFIDGSYRVEWAKSFQQFAKVGEYISFDFYSVGANAQLDKIFDLGPKVNNLKLRSSFSVVGNPIPNNNFYAQTRNFYTGGVSGAAPKFDNPRPETTTSFEVGLDGAMFQNRWDWDLTFYNSTLENQFMYVDGGVPVNSGKIRNWGVEFSTNYRFDITKDLSWRPGFNISYNDNKILETYTKPDGSEYIYATGPNKFKIKYVKGGAYGDIYVNSFERDANGHIVLQADGQTPLLASGFNTNVGNATARVNFGFSNTFTYKDFQLYFLIDGKIGGKVMSLTQPDMDLYGVSVRSAEARDRANAEFPRGWVELPDGTGRKVDAVTYYQTIGGNPIEDYIYDATNLRLRDLTLGYTFRDLIATGKDLQLSLLARNLFFIYKNSPIDPDISQSAGNGFGGIEAYALPTTTTIGLSARVTF